MCVCVCVSVYVGGGGGGGRGGNCPLDLLSQTSQVSGWIMFSLDSVVLIVVCCALQLFAIFMAEKLVGPRCVQIVRKMLVSQTSWSIVK